MSSQACDTVRELLVDYGDGELSAAEAGRVAAHLAECPECRAELRVLERSLELAQSVWRESAAQSVLEESTGTPPLPLGEGWGEGFFQRIPDRRRTQAAVAVVACVAAVLLAAGSWLFWHALPGGELDPTKLAAPLEHPASQPVSRGRKSPTILSTATETEESPPAPPSEDPDVETLIARVGRAARLAASAELLAAHPGLEPYRARADRYLAEVYRGTPAGDRAATRVGPRANEANKEPES